LAGSTPPTSQHPPGANPLAMCSFCARLRLLVLVWGRLFQCERTMEAVSIGVRLNIFAVTLNNGGKKMSQELVDDLVEDKDDATDLVILGLQEDKSSSIPFPGSLRGWKEYQVDGHRACPNGKKKMRVYVRSRKDNEEEWSHSLETVSPSIFDNAKKAGHGIKIKTDRNIMECGKGFLLVKLKFSKGDRTRNVCAMTTHMSKKGTAEYRATRLQEAHDISKGASCDATVFVGDFNSRLKCRRTDQTYPIIPMYSHCTPSPKSGYVQNSCEPDNTLSPLQYVYHQFCHRTDPSVPHSCNLGNGGKAQADELVQLLENSIIRCFENLHNPQEYSYFNIESKGFDYQWRELQTPAFIPTYKVSKKCNEKGMWLMDITETFCWRNTKKEKAPSNNPAWTDRILVGVLEGGSWSAQKYTAKLPISLESDHLPVIGQMTLEVP